jgi:cytidylate kinase
LGRLSLGLDVVSDGDRVLLEGRDVAERIRDADITAAVSTVAAHPEVRAALMGLQRRLASARDVVMEGRDIGSTVLPDAEVKVFLTASLAERARRRWLQDGSSGDPASIEASIEARDLADESRAHSPLVRAPDSREVETTGKTIDDVVAEIVSLVAASGSENA